MRGKIKCGVAGVGYLGQHHARIYSELDGCLLVGVCDTNGERAREIANGYGCVAFNSIGELGEACDCVSVATPTGSHCAVALQLIGHNCHLLIEKPLTSTAAEAEKILKAAAGRDRILQVGLIEHYNPVMKFLEESVVQPKFVVSQRLSPYSARGTDVGVVLDLKIHDIGIILQLVRSDVKSIDAVGLIVLSKAEDIANARLHFANGCVADLNASRVSEKKLREIRIFQPRGYISMDFTAQSGHLMEMTASGLSRSEIPVEKDEPLKTEIASFLRCVGEHSAPKVDIHFGKMTLELALRICDAINSRS
jgi:predicted dehydrogenase